MLGLTARLFDTQPVIAFLQDPFQFFRDVTNREVRYSWITGYHPAEPIRLHPDMVSHVLEEVAKRLDSRYEPGQRSGAWQKMRHAVVGGHGTGPS